MSFCHLPWHFLDWTLSALCVHVFAWHKSVAQRKAEVFTSWFKYQCVVTGRRDSHGQYFYKHMYLGLYYLLFHAIQWKANGKTTSWCPFQSPSHWHLGGCDLHHGLCAALHCTQWWTWNRAYPESEKGRYCSYQCKVVFGSLLARPRPAQKEAIK